MNQFSEYYKSLSNTELIRIIENKEDYQFKAVEAAEFEINQRNISQNEYNKALIHLNKKREKEEKINIILYKYKRCLKSLFYSIFDTINPIQKKNPTSERLVNFITTVFTLILIFRLPKEILSIKLLFEEFSSFFQLESIVILLMLYIAIFFFWRRRKVGWILMMVYIVYSIVALISAIFFTIKFEATYNDVYFLINPQDSFITLFVAMFFYFCFFLLLVKKNVRLIYKINTSSMKNIISIIILFTSIHIIILTIYVS